MATNKNATRIQSLSKAIRVLEGVVKEGSPVSLTTLSNELDIAQSTIHRLLSSLQLEGYIKQDEETRKYTIGRNFTLLALRVYQQKGLIKEAQPHLESLTRKTGETSNLVILAPNQREVVYIRQAVSEATVKGSSLVGRRAPAYATALGKVLLAFKTWQEVSNIFNKNDLEPLTENTITDLNELQEELEEIEEKELAVDREECEKGAACVAAPVKNHRAEVEASISISGPPVRILGERFERFTQITKNEAKNLSKELGYETMAE